MATQTCIRRGLDTIDRSLAFRQMVFNIAAAVRDTIIVSALQTLSRVVFFVYWLMLIFTGKLHPGSSAP